MRFLTLYLSLYFVVLAAAVWVLWHAGILGRIPGAWIGLGAVVAIGLGVLLALVSRTVVVTTSE